MHITLLVFCGISRLTNETSFFSSFPNDILSQFLKFENKIFLEIIWQIFECRSWSSTILSCFKLMTSGTFNTRNIFTYRQIYLKLTFDDVMIFVLYLLNNLWFIISGDFLQLNMEVKKYLNSWMLHEYFHFLYEQYESEQYLV